MRPITDLILAGTLLLCACAPTLDGTSATGMQDIPHTAWNLAEAARIECHARLDRGDFQTHVEMVSRCLNPKITEIYEKDGYEDMDLILLIGAKRLELAEEVDAGKITVGQASVTLAEFAVTMTKISRQRHLDDKKTPCGNSLLNDDDNHYTATGLEPT